MYLIITKIIHLYKILELAHRMIGYLYYKFYLYIDIIVIEDNTAAGQDIDNGISFWFKAVPTFAFPCGVPVFKFNCAGKNHYRRFQALLFLRSCQPIRKQRCDA